MLSAGRTPVSEDRVLSAQDVEQLNVVPEELHKELAGLSPQGRLVAEESGHYIQVEQPSW